MKTFTANENMAHTLFIQRTERTPCRLPLVLQGILKSPHCSTLLIHSTCLERQRTQAVDSLESPVTKVLVCRGSFQKWDAQHYQNFTLVKQHLFKVVIENSVVFDILYFIQFFMTVLVKYFKKFLNSLASQQTKRFPDS